MTLTDKQRSELHAAILEYFVSLGESYRDSAQAFADDGSLVLSPPEQQLTPPVPGRSLLERKWTSIARLQKKVIDLEEKLAVISSAGSNTLKFADSGAKGRSLLPCPPAKATLVGHRSAVNCLCIHPVYSICASGSEDATVRIWDTDSATHEQTLRGHSNSVQGVSFSPDGSQLASCSMDMSLKIWDFTASPFDCVKTLRGHDQTVSSVTWLPGGDRLVSCGRDATIRVWEALTGFCIKTLTGHSEWVRCVATAEPENGSQIIVSGSHDHTVRLWDLAMEQEIRVLTGHTHVVESVAISSYSENVTGQVKDALDCTSCGVTGGGLGKLFIASASRDKSVRLWCAGTGECIACYEFHKSWVKDVLFHPNAPYILSCSDDCSIRVVDLKTGRCCRVIESSHDQFMSCMALQLQSKGILLLTGSSDKSIRVWECR